MENLLILDSNVILVKQMGRFLYFTYGSNMCTGRLTAKERCPSGISKCVAKLSGHVLKFHKLSKKDCSGKADAYETGNENDVVWGVVFSIDDSEEDAKNVIILGIDILAALHGYALGFSIGSMEREYGESSGEQNSKN